MLCHREASKELGTVGEELLKSAGNKRKEDTEEDDEGNVHVGQEFRQVVAAPRFSTFPLISTAPMKIQPSVVNRKGISLAPWWGQSCLHWSVPRSCQRPRLEDCFCPENTTENCCWELQVGYYIWPLATLSENTATIYKAMHRGLHMVHQQAHASAAAAPALARREPRCAAWLCRSMPS